MKFPHQFTEIFNSITKLQDAIANMDFEGVMQSMQALVNATLNGLSDAFNTFKQIEIDNVEAKYDAEIKAAQGNGEEIERLEQEKAQKKLDVEKKYADVQFAIKASEILANTALAITMALAQLGPIARSYCSRFNGGNRCHTIGCCQCRTAESQEYDSFRKFLLFQKRCSCCYWP